MMHMILQICDVSGQRIWSTYELVLCTPARILLFDPTSICSSLGEMSDLPPTITSCTEAFSAAVVTVFAFDSFCAIPITCRTLHEPCSVAD